MNWTRGFLIFLILAIVSGCATMPTGPTVAALPGPGKPFEVFQADDYACRQWAQQQIGGASPSQTANQNLASGAVVGTLVGAGLGAAIGAATGNVGAGAAIGAGAGLLTGTAVASGPAASSEYQLQRRYDITYQQCMYAKGNQIPGAGYSPPLPGEAPPPVGYGPPPPEDAPPPYAFAAPPDVVPIPGTYAYFVPGIGMDVLFYQGYWYRPFRGRWYSAQFYNGPWIYVPGPRVPRVLFSLPPGWRRVPRGYRPIAHAELQRNWQRWERERHWEEHR